MLQWCQTQLLLLSLLLKLWVKSKGRLLAICSDRTQVGFIGLGSQINLCFMEMRDRQSDGVRGPFRAGDWGRPWYLHANENDHGKYVNLPDCGWLRQTVLFQKGQMLLWVITYGNWIHLTITVMAQHLTRACDVLCTQSHIRENRERPFFPSSGHQGEKSHSCLQNRISKKACRQ